MKIRNELKKFTTVLLSAALVVASSMPVLAANEQTWTGTLQSVTEDKIVVTVTTSEVAKFNIDPSRLLYQYGHDEGLDNYPDDVTVIFSTNDTGANGKPVYKQISAPITVSNNSTVSVNVVLKGKIEDAGAEPGKARISTLNDVDGEDAPAIAIALCDGGSDGTEDNEAKNLTADGTEVTASMNSAVDNYKKVPDGGEVDGIQKWKYEETDPTNSTLETKYYTLKGAATPGDKVDWTSVTTIPKVKLTWVIKKTNGEFVMTDDTAYGAWSGASLVLGVDATNGFPEAPTKVEVSADGTTWVELTNAKYSVDASNKVTATYADMSAALSGTAAAYVRVTAGSTRYTFTQ